MRLRYLHLQGVPPLTDLSVVFGHEPVLGRQVAIRFVVGVNGSGKTRFLQSLAEIFLHLERPDFPPFPVTLVYDLHTGEQPRTIYLRHQPGDSSRSALIEFTHELKINEDVEWEDLPELIQQQPEAYPIKGKPYLKGDLPGSGSITSLLPSAILVYTSGATTRWQKLFTPEIAKTELLPESLDPEIERPMRWNLEAEKKYQADEGNPLSEEVSEWIDEELNQRRAISIGQFVEQDSLKLAVCAVTLVQAAEDFRKIHSETEAGFLKIALETKTGLRIILNTIDWLYPVTIGLRLRLEHERLTKRQSQQLTALFRCATSVIRDPVEQPGRLVLFDLQRLLPKDISTAAALIEALAHENASEPFDLFRTLKIWHDIGLLEDVSITIRKRNLDDLLLYDWLSDGEKMFLGRMSLLHLLRKREDALIILDEPETHFNDYWKRQIVDIIDDNLRNVASEVIISTHSSIALTDVFDTEITLLKKSRDDGSIYTEAPVIQTFGASPSEIMRKVFEAPDIVGQRANEFLDMALKVAAYPTQVEKIWQIFSVTKMLADSTSQPIPDQYEGIKQLDEFKSLWVKVQEIKHYYENDRRLYDFLRSLWLYTNQENPELGIIKVIDALRMLEEKIGPGYYRFEFNRRLQALEEMNPDASQS